MIRKKDRTFLLAKILNHKVFVVGFSDEPHSNSNLTCEEIAIIHEFGLGNQKETAFFRNAFDTFYQTNYNEIRMVYWDAVRHLRKPNFNRLKEKFAEQVRLSILAVDLVDTGQLLESVEVREDDK